MKSIRPRRLVDDGATVLVDLHGCGVEDGVRIIVRLLTEAYQRGRSKVDVIHGASTSDLSGYARTLKNALREELEAGGFAQWASGHIESPDGGRTSIWLKIGSRSNPSRITPADL